MRLTELTLPKLAPGVYMDDRVPDFGIRVGQRRRSWIVVRGRGRVKTTFGHFPELSLSDARTEAKRLLTATPDKQPSKRFEEARDAFLDHYEKPSTRYQVERVLKTRFTPFHGHQLTSITEEAINDCLARIRAPSARLHAFRYLRAMLRWCQRPPRRWIKHSPLEGYEPPGKDRRGTRILTDDELVRVWYASPAIFRLMILWGVRNTEACILEREWITNGVMTIPGRLVKNGRDHAIPVCTLAEYVMQGDSNQYVFPGRWGGHISPGALGKLKREVDVKSGVTDWQLRDLRRTFRSNMARLKVPRDICELLINHAPPVLDDIYNRYEFIEEKREALAKYEAALVWLLARA